MRSGVVAFVLVAACSGEAPAASPPPSSAPPPSASIAAAPPTSVAPPSIPSVQDARRLCADGIAAYDRGAIDEAERELAAGVAAWPDPPAIEDEAPLSRCLYQRGLVARDRADLDLARESWTRSVALRPDRNVQEHLDALDAPLAEIAGSSRLEAWIESTRASLGATVTVFRDAFVAGAEPESGLQGLRFVGASGPAPVHAHMALVWPDGIHDLGAPAQREASGMNAHGFFWDATIEGPRGALGDVVSFVVDARESHPSPRPGIACPEEHRRQTLFVCAEHRSWSCATVSLVDVVELDCDICTCQDPESEEDPSLPRYYGRGHALEATPLGETFSLSPDTREHLTEPEAAPLAGDDIALASLFDRGR